MKKNLPVFISVIFTFILSINSVSAQIKQDKLLFGVAYYDEYMPYERLDKDIKMMKETGINVVRIAESTWSTMEPQEGVFDFSHIDRVLNAMHKAGISVIIGTPTYAVPTWLVKKHPDVLAITNRGPNQYGPRQNMDITNIHFRNYAEKAIRKMLEHIKDHPAIIGYQIDNETKSYGTSGPNVQAQFVAYMKSKYPSLDDLNKIFGLDYWSNRINNWDDFPSVNGSINASLNAEFAKFQRSLVTEYLSWQSKMVREYKKTNQFVTQNFDFDWWGHTYGIQPEVDHFAASKVLDISGVDIYHPSQDKLTGLEISFGGDVARSMKGGQNYFVIETEAQGFAEWVPYPAQLRLQAFSHLASGADMVSYWHWHSIHNSAETYWKGLLSHDFEPNPTYEEAKTIGADFKKLSPHLIHLQKKNDVAVLFSNEALTAYNSFGPGNYNGILRPMYDALYKMNVGVDFIDPSSIDIEKYKLIVVPALYAAPDSLLIRLNNFVKNGGHIVYTFKSGFSDEHNKVRTVRQPGIISEACGITYSEFTVPEKVGLKNDPFNVGKEYNKAEKWMELLVPVTAKVLAYYDHPQWGIYAAVTQNNYGKGTAAYIGFGANPALNDKILEGAVKNAGLWGKDQELKFPIIVKSGTNQLGKIIHYYFNYSSQEVSFIYPHKKGNVLLTEEKLASQSKISLPAWGFTIIEEL
ncbi:beta-galactosidase [Flavobacterium sp. CF108]|uniref:beta-galactosidase n=1 Tax=unclassified Flavobacterium TaxID=196869 RepID=UPI0008BF35E9|nr:MULTISPECIES: beta-galactosidase [unclassified Flavobacterium]SEO15063.1 beta-galactosidase [Flavobacterium sp. fv08]SHG57696.1 beta-galactosidase [Flavobacterium sp. CF108]